MIVCNKCGTENPDTNNFCKVCGNAIKEKKAEKRQSDDLFDTFTKTKVDPIKAPPRRAESDDAPLRPRARKKSVDVMAILSVIIRFLKKTWKWLLPSIAGLIAIITIVSVIASIKPDHGLLALTPEYLQFSMSSETAEGAIPLVGLMDSHGKTVLSCNYQSVLAEIDEGVFAVIGSNAKIGAVNLKNKAVIPFDYLSADTESGFSEGLWAVESSDGWGYVDKKGKIKIPFSFERALGFSEGLAAVYNGEKWGYINKKGEVVIDYTFDTAYHFNDGLARVSTNGLYGFINDKGEFKIEAKFSSAYPYFDDGLCLVKVNNRYGFINEKGEFEINPQFDDALPFSEDLAAVMLEDKIGYINKKGKYVIEPKYDGELNQGNMFYKGGAVVYLEEMAVVINKKGKEILSSEEGYSFISHLHDGFYIVQKDGKFGLLSKKKNQVTLEPTYEEILFAFRDTVVFKTDKENVSVIISGNGETVTETSADLSSMYFLSTVTKKARAVSDWCMLRM